MPIRPTTQRQRLVHRALTELIPRAPLSDFEPIYERATAKRLRSQAPDGAAFLAATTHIRHRHTDYDDLLAEGYDRESARHFVLDDINDTLTLWGANRFVDRSADDAGNDPGDA